MIQHQVESLAAAGVTDIVLAVNYRPEIMTAALSQVRPGHETHIRPIPPLVNDFEKARLTVLSTVREALQRPHQLLRRD